MMLSYARNVLLWSLLFCLDEAHSHEDDVFDTDISRSFLKPSYKPRETIKMSFKIEELAQREGFALEKHFAVTEDGYVLALHRLVTPRAGRGPRRGRGRGRERTPGLAQEQPRWAALLWHGLLGSSADWLIGGAQHGLAFLLARENIDVWMGNTRGNIYSRNHTELECSEQQFWNFSLHEVATQDLPAGIDAVLEATGAPRLHVVAHSTTAGALLAMLAELPEYNAKLHVAFVLAPVAYMSATSSPLLRVLAAASTGVILPQVLANLMGEGEFRPSPALLGALENETCSRTAPSPSLCKNILFRLAGFDSQQLQPSISDITKSVPAGTSTKLLLHLGQLIESGKFQNYDYGIANNKYYHGKIIAPEYHLRDVFVRVVLFFSDNDWLANRKDVSRLTRQLPRVIAKFRVPRPDFNNLDFLWASDAPELVYRRLIHLLVGFNFE